MNNNLYENIYKNGTNFSFGKNWQIFIKNLTNEKIEDAKKSISGFLGFDLEGKTFIDIGCGSGLFSLSAYLLGAKKIISVDIDENSVLCAKYLKEKQGNPENWKIITGSVLDIEFIKSLGTYDVVYSWGVLHHTGNMYKAFDNIIHLMGTGSYLYIAIYNKYISSRIWLYIKKLYNMTPNILKYFWIILYYIYATILLGLQGKWILSEMKNYGSSSRGGGRGMSYHIDVIDWLGGYPYEYATTEEVISYFEKYKLETVKYINGSGPACNEILFKKL